jgi:hypothetical protein
VDSGRQQRRCGYGALISVAACLGKEKENWRWSWVEDEVACHFIGQGREGGSRIGDLQWWNSSMSDGFEFGEVK